jgi:hypothetical protein
MKFFFDENLPPTLPEALHILHKTAPEDAEVSYIPDIFGKGAPDEKWITGIAKDGSATIITCDHQIHKRSDQKKLYREAGLGLVVLKPPSKTGLPYWQMVQKIIKHWKEIIEIDNNTLKPYLFLISVSGKTVLKYDGNNWRDK